MEKYILLTHYSYDMPMVSGFYTYKDACDLLFENFTEEVRVEEEENMITLEEKVIDTPHSYAKIVDGDGNVTEWYVVNATHLNNLCLPEQFVK